LPGSERDPGRTNRRAAAARELTPLAEDWGAVEHPGAPRRRGWPSGANTDVEGFLPPWALPKAESRGWCWAAAAVPGRWWRSGWSGIWSESSLAAREPPIGARSLPLKPAQAWPPTCAALIGPRAAAGPALAQPDLVVNHHPGGQAAYGLPAALQRAGGLPPRDLLSLRLESTRRGRVASCGEARERCCKVWDGAWRCWCSREPQRYALWLAAAATNTVSGGQRCAAPSPSSGTTP